MIHLASFYCSNVKKKGVIYIFLDQSNRKYKTQAIWIQGRNGQQDMGSL